MKRYQAFLIAVTCTLVSLSMMVSIPKTTSAYTLRAPIYIDGDAAFNSSNGVVGGSGTYSDPFIIEGWEINASDAHQILIINTELHFIIRDVYLHSGNSIFDGISLQNSDNGTIESSRIEDNRAGVSIADSLNVTLRANIFRNDGVEIDNNRDSEQYYVSHTITPDNILNGKPILYYKNCSNLDVNGIVTGQLIIANCTNVRISGLNINKSVIGISAFLSSNVTIQNNFITNCWGGLLSSRSTDIEIRDNKIFNSRIFGLGIGISSNIGIQNNTIFNSTASGIFFDTTENSTIMNNILSNNWGGLILEDSVNVTITLNTISDSERSIMLVSSLSVLATRAKVYHNNFVSNTIQALDDRDNIWNDSYPSGGNFWSNYTGVDNCSGPLQNICPEPDGIGDTPFIIDADSRDNYPLMKLGGDMDPPTVTITYPMNQQNVTLPFEVNGTASDIGGTGIKFVEISAYDWPHEWPYEWHWMNATGTTSWNATIDFEYFDQYPPFVPPLNNITISARAWDNAGNPSPIISVTVKRQIAIIYFPQASFNVSPTSGDIPTVFTFNATSSYSRCVPNYTLEFRWDWEDDGVWDTPWSGNATVEHQYQATGTYTVRLEVKDDCGLASNTTRQVVVQTPAQIDATLWLSVIGIIAVIMVILLVMLFRRRRRKSLENSMEDTQNRDEG